MRYTPTLLAFLLSCANLGTGKKYSFINYLSLPKAALDGLHRATIRLIKSPAYLLLAFSSFDTEFCPTLFVSKKYRQIASNIKQDRINKHCNL